MKRLVYSLLGIGTVLTALSFVSAQEPKAKEPTKPASDSGAAAVRAKSIDSLDDRFHQDVINYVNGTLLLGLDKNGDGYLDKAEWTKGNWSPSQPPENSDLNKDGKLSREELCIRISKSRGIPYKGEEMQPSETRERSSPPREPRREGDPNRPPPREDGDFDGPRDRPPPPREGGPPPRGGFGPGGPGPGGPGFRPDDGRGRGPGFGPRGPNYPGGSRMEPGGDLFLEDPEMATLSRADFDLDQQTRELADRLRGAKKDDREKIRGELTEVVNKHFDIRQQRRELQIKRMEDELKKLREAMTKRNEAKDQIIKKRLAELVGNEDDLGF